MYTATVYITRSPCTCVHGHRVCVHGHLVCAYTVTVYMCTRSPCTCVHGHLVCAYTVTVYVCTRSLCMYVHGHLVCAYTVTVYVCTRSPCIWVHGHRVCVHGHRVCHTLTVYITRSPCRFVHIEVYKPTRVEVLPVEDHSSLRCELKVCFRQRSSQGVFQAPGAHLENVQMCVILHALTDSAGVRNSAFWLYCNALFLKRCYFHFSDGNVMSRDCVKGHFNYVPTSEHFFSQLALLSFKNRLLNTC